MHRDGFQNPAAIPVALQAGLNTIAFSHSIGCAPDIDYIQVGHL